jgi:membrane protease YdiL (CAAX protease family)
MVRHLAPAALAHNISVYPLSPLIVIAAVLALAPYFWAGFCPARFTAPVRSLPLAARILLPSLLCVPYVLVTIDRGTFSLRWLALYAVLPAAMALCLAVSGSLRAGNIWLEYLVLAVLGLAVDLRWFERAWPAHLSVFNKVLLLDAGIYAFVAIRQLDGVGFDLRLRLRDILIGLREFVFFFPFALGLGLALGFLHLHPLGSGVGTVALKFAGAWIYTFLFIAVPEELFFRGWVQNLLERHIGRRRALLATAILFGLSHFNKRALHFNWRYVLLAAIAGIFYGRAWRSNRRVPASSVTHATIDSVWSLWLR